MITSHTLKFIDSPKTYKSKYLENKTLFFSSDKKIYSSHIKGYNMTKDSFPAEVTFN